MEESVFKSKAVCLSIEQMALRWCFLVIAELKLLRVYFAAQRRADRFVRTSHLLTWSISLPKTSDSNGVFESRQIVDLTHAHAHLSLFHPSFFLVCGCANVLESDSDPNQTCFCFACSVFLSKFCFCALFPHPQPAVLLSLAPVPCACLL